MEATTHDAGCRGAIDVVGDIEFANDPGNDPTIVDPDTAMYWIYDAYAVHASYPAFDVRKMLTPVGMSVYGRYHRDIPVLRVLPWIPTRCSTQ